MDMFIAQDCTEAFILFGFTDFAAFWLILQSLISKKELFSGGKDKVLITFYAL
jgi:hypothetical protein